MPNSRNDKVSSAARRQWPVRVLFFLLGLAMIAIGIESIAQGYWWIRNYNPWSGVIGTGPVLVLAFIGGLFVLLSLIPWPRRQEKAKSKDKLYKVP